MGFEVAVLDRRPADRHVAVGEGELEEVEVDGMGHASGVAAKHFEIEGAGLLGPVALDIP